MKLCEIKTNNNEAVDQDPVHAMAAALTKAGFEDVHVEDSYKPGKPHGGFVISFDRERRGSSDTFSLFYDQKKGEWALSVQGDSQDLEVDTELKNIAEIRRAVRGVTNAWFREADPDWTD